MQGGINIGIDTCWFNPHGKEVPEDMHLTYVVSELSQIGDILLK